MGCGSSKVNVIDGEPTDDVESGYQHPSNGIKVSAIEEKERKLVQFSSGLQSNEGKNSFFQSK